MNIENRTRKLNNIEFNELKLTSDQSIGAYQYFKEGNNNLVIYVMSRDQRIEDNHALIYAQTLGNVVVLFNLYPKVPNRIFQQYEFMIDGLKELQISFKDLNIPFLIMTDRAIDNLRNIEKILKPKAFVFDFSPLRGPRALKSKFVEESKASLFEVDTHNIIPVWIASDKEEFAAYTLRPKIYKQLNKWLIEPEVVKKQDKFEIEFNISNAFINPSNSDWIKISKFINAERIEGYNPKSKSGTIEAKKTLKLFLSKKIEFYSEKRNDPNLDFQSNLSPYLHYGQISSLRIVLETQKLMIQELGKKFNLDFYKNKAGYSHIASIEDSIYAFIEEVVVRKELSENYCYYNQKYDQIEGAKDWALKSHIKHYKDKRDVIYSYLELELATTHDDAWNTAQKQLISNGKIPGYMRMYWAKKILEWTVNPRQALEWCIKLNDKYHLDGYDPNGYVGIMWSLNGLHDRPWFEREIFGQIRYMNYEGLKKKFDLKEYVK